MGKYSTGQVVLSDKHGNSRVFSANSGDVRRSGVSTLPLILIQAETGYEFLFDTAVRLTNDTVLTHESNLGVWMTWSLQEFSNNFTFAEEVPLYEMTKHTETESLGLTVTASGTAVNYFKNGLDGSQNRIDCSASGWSNFSATGFPVATVDETQTVGFNSHNMYCSASGGYDSATINAVVQSTVVVMRGFYQGSGNCTNTVLAEVVTGDGVSALSTTVSNTVNHLCSATVEAWLYSGYIDAFDGTNTIGFTPTHHYLGHMYYQDYGAYAEHSEIDFSFAKAFTDPVDLQYYIVEQNDLYWLDQDDNWKKKLMLSELESDPYYLYTGLELVGTVDEDQINSVLSD